MSLACGAVGALVLNVLHETARKTTPVAPHVDVIGMRAIGKPLRKIGIAPRSMGVLRKLALAGDLISNSLYFSAAAQGPNRWSRALSLGAAAGLGAVTLPPAMGLGDESGRHSTPTSVMTFTWYLAGALAAAGTSLFVDRAQRSGKAHLRLVERPTYV